MYVYYYIRNEKIFPFVPFFTESGYNSKFREGISEGIKGILGVKKGNFKKIFGGKKSC